MAWHRHGYTAVVTPFGWNTFFLGGSQQADAVAGLLVLVINARKLGLTQQRAEENSTLNAYMVRRRRTGGVAGQDMELDAECIHGEL